MRIILLLSVSLIVCVVVVANHASSVAATAAASTAAIIDYSDGTTADADADADADAGAAGPALSREIVSFDWNWKHRLGLHGWVESPYDKPINTSELFPDHPKYIDPRISPKEAQTDYNDTDWITVHTPHDALISNPFGNEPSRTACPDGCSGQSFIPRHVIWYRKTFRLPKSWRISDKSINDDDDDDDDVSSFAAKVYMQFDGSFRNTTVYLNGNRVLNHDCGYTPFSIELTPGREKIYTVAIFVDPNNGDDAGQSRGSGWWYEGGGLYRHVRLVKLMNKNAHLKLYPNDAVFVKSRVIVEEAASNEEEPTQAKAKKNTKFQHLRSTDSQTNAEKEKEGTTAFHRQLYRNKRHSHLNTSNNSTDSSSDTDVVAVVDVQVQFELLSNKDDKTNDDYCYTISMMVDQDLASSFSNDEQKNKNKKGGCNCNKDKGERTMTPLKKLSSFSTSTTTKDAATATVVTENVSLSIHNPKLWTSSEPNLYKVTAKLYKNCGFPRGNDVGKNRRNSSKRNTTEIASSIILIDTVTVTHGIRTIEFDANTGFYLNNKPYKVRGFCDHDTFAVVGMAVPDRVHLFRAQASRSIGGNARRTSHNPTDPFSLDVYDRLGMVVISENRLFANDTRYVRNMGQLVKRDRNHPSVIIWSFCNEVGCRREAGGPSFQNVTKMYDPSRPTLANMFGFNDLLSNTIDVQGFSHRPRKQLDDCHAQMKDKPIMQSECCSCNTMRSEDIGCETTSDNPHSTCNQMSFNARCLENLVNASDGTEYASGTFVWTLFDYYGEPPSRGLTVSSTYGQYDLCGFPKSSAFWFRSQWLLKSPTSSTTSDSDSDSISNGRPYSTGSFDDDRVEVHIVESWESPDSWNETKGNITRTIHAYSNAPVIELFVNLEDDDSNDDNNNNNNNNNNGDTDTFVESSSSSTGRSLLLSKSSSTKSQGKRYLTPMIEGDQGTYGEWLSVPWEFGSITAIAQSLNGTELARTVKKTNVVHNNNKNSGGDYGPSASSASASSLVLSLDSPSPHTGTGSALFLDGQDTALVRATVVDAEGVNTLHFATNNITFSVVSGPGYIQGTANGDPKSYQSHTSSSQVAYHGLVRAVVKVTSMAGLSSREKLMVRQMDVVTGTENTAVTEEQQHYHYNDNNSNSRKSLLSFDDDSDIVIEATSPGLEPVRLTVPTSTDKDTHSVLAVASRGVNHPLKFF